MKFPKKSQQFQPIFWLRSVFSASCRTAAITKPKNIVIFKFINRKFIATIFTFPELSFVVSCHLAALTIWTKHVFFNPSYISIHQTIFQFFVTIVSIVQLSFFILFPSLTISINIFEFLYFFFSTEDIN